MGGAIQGLGGATWGMVVTEGTLVSASIDRGPLELVRYQYGFIRVWAK